MGIINDAGEIITHSVSKGGEVIWSRTMGVVDRFLESGRQADRRLADRGLERRGDDTIELTLILVLLALPPALGFVVGRMTTCRQR